jgi:hypothetical protein
MLWEGWSPGPASAACDVTITVGETPLPAPAYAAPLAYGRLSGWVSDDFLSLRSDLGGLTVDYGNAAGRLWLPETGFDPAFARDTLWRLLTLELARTQGRYYLHGAAWLGPEGADVVCADGGTGKSTLAAIALAAGHPVITDDGALLVPGRSLAVTALPTAWRVSSPASGWIGLAESAEKQRFWPPADQQIELAPIGRLLFAERGDRMALLPLAPAEVLPRLIRQNPLLMTSRHLATAHVGALRDLAETVPAFRLLLGPEMLTNRQTVLNLLAM